MSPQDWMLGGLGLAILGMLFEISRKLDRIADIAHRIRINDRDRGF